MVLHIDRKADSLGQLSLQIVVAPIALSCLLIVASPFAAQAGLADQTQFGAGIVVALLLQSALAWFALQRNVHAPLRRLVDYLREVRQGRSVERPPETSGVLRDVIDLTRDVIQTQLMMGHYIVSIHAIDEVTQTVRTAARTAKAELTGIAHSTAKLVENLNQNSGQLSQAFKEVHKSLEAEASKLDRMRDVNAGEIETVRLAPVMFDNAVSRFEERANAVLQSVGKDPLLVSELENLTRAVRAAGSELKETSVDLADVKATVRSTATRDDLNALDSAVRQASVALTAAVEDIRGQMSSQSAAAVEAIVERSKSTVEPVLNDLRLVTNRIEPAFAANLSRVQGELAARLSDLRTSADADNGRFQTIEDGVRALGARIEAVDGVSQAVLQSIRSPEESESRRKAADQLIRIADELDMLRQQSISATATIGELGQDIARSTAIHEKSIPDLLAASDAKYERLSAKAQEFRAESETAFQAILSRIEHSLSSVVHGLIALDQTSSQVGRSLADSRASIDQLNIGQNFEKLFSDIAHLSRGVESIDGGIEEAARQAQQAVVSQDTAASRTREAIEAIGKQLAAALAETRHTSEARFDSASQELGDHIAEALRKLTALSAAQADQSQALDRISSAGLQPIAAMTGLIQERMSELHDYLKTDVRLDETRDRLQGIEQILGKVTDLLGLVEQQATMTMQGVGGVAGDVKRAFLEQQSVSESIKEEMRQLDGRMMSRLGASLAVFQGDISRSVTIRDEDLAQIDRRFATVDAVARAIADIRSLIQSSDDAPSVMKQLEAVSERVYLLDRRWLDQDSRVAESLSEHRDLQGQMADSLAQNIAGMTAAQQAEHAERAAQFEDRMQAVVSNVQRQADDAVNRLMSAILATKAAMIDQLGKSAEPTTAIEIGVGALFEELRNRLELVLDRLDDQSPRELRSLIEAQLRDQSANLGRFDQVVDRLQAMHLAIDDIASGSLAFESVASAIQPLKDSVQSFSDAQGSILQGVSRQVIGIAETLTGAPDAMTRQLQNLATRGDLARVESRLGNLSDTLARTPQPGVDAAASRDLDIGTSRSVAIYPSLREMAATQGGGSVSHATVDHAAGLAGRLDDLFDRVEENSESVHRGLAEVRTMLSAVVADLQPSILGVRAEVVRLLTDLSTTLDTRKAADSGAQIERSISAMGRRFDEFKDYTAALAQSGISEVLAGIRTIPSGRGDSTDILNALDQLQRTVGEAFAQGANVIRLRPSEHAAQTSELLQHAIDVSSRIDDVVVRLDRIYDSLDTREPVWPNAALARPNVEADVQPAYEKVRQLAQFADMALARLQAAMVAAGSGPKRDLESDPAIGELSREIGTFTGRVAALDLALQRISCQIDELSASIRPDEANAALAETLLELETRIETALNGVKDEFKAFGELVHDRPALSAESRSVTEPTTLSEQLSPSMTTVLKLMSGFTSAIEDRFGLIEAMQSGQVAEQDDAAVKTFDDSLAAMRKLTDEFLDISSAISSELSSHIEDKAQGLSPQVKRAPDLRRNRR